MDIASGVPGLPEERAVALLRKLPDEALARIAFTLVFVRFFRLSNFLPVREEADTIEGRLKNLNTKWQIIKDDLSFLVNNVEVPGGMIRRIVTFLNFLFVELPSLARAGVRLLQLLGRVDLEPVAQTGVFGEDEPPTI